MATRSDKTIYELFSLSIIFKGITSFAEVVVGILLVFVPGALILNSVLPLAREGIDGDADDVIAEAVIHFAQTFVLNNELFLGIYIFIRGFVQLTLVYFLFRNKLWAYPAFIAVLCIVICTQLYAIYLSHSLITAAITAIDLVTVYLVSDEYRIVRKAVA